MNDFGYDINFKMSDIEERVRGLNIEEQNEVLKRELEACFFEKGELLRHINFLNSQVSKLSELV